MADSKNGRDKARSPRSENLISSQKARNHDTSDTEPFMATIVNYEEIEFNSALTSDPIWPARFVIRNGRVHRSDPEKYDPADTKYLEKKLSELKKTGFFKRVCNNQNYTDAITAINTRCKQSKNERYKQPWAEIKLLEMIHECHRLYEVSGLLKAEEVIPSVDDLRKLRTALDKASELSFRYSSVLPELGLGRFAWEVSHHIERLDAILKTYRKRRSGAKIREILFAESVAIELKKRFGVCEHAIFAPICAMVGYVVSVTTLTASAKNALSRQDQLAKFDRTEIKAQ
jgi:hypothetical protein